MVAKRKSPQLLPCPFCGVVPKGPFDKDGCWEIWCQNEHQCNVCPDVLDVTREEAIDCWNKRFMFLRPIETAPKTGEIILAFNKNDDIEAIAWHNGRWVDKYSKPVEYKYTHWFPYPEWPARGGE